MTFDVISFALSMLGLLLSMIIHEQMHARVAYWLGDPTGKDANRFSWNPAHHLDPFMSVILPGLLYIGTKGKFIFGGAKPCPIQAMNFRNPSLGMCLSAAAGPLSNFGLAAIGVGLTAILYRVVPSSLVAGVDLTPNGFFFVSFTFTNLFLGAFNLLPIPPLDGARIIRHFSPREIQDLIDTVERFGMILVMVLAYAGMNQVVRPLRELGHRIFYEVNGLRFYEALARSF